MRLTPFDEAALFVARADNGHSQRRIAADFGCSQAHVSKRLSLLRLHPDLRAAVISGDLEIGEALKLARCTDVTLQLAEFRAMQDRRTALYRHFDADSVLLYVGISDGLGHRTVEHGRTAEWTRYVHRSVAVWFDDRPSAKRSEAAAVQAELPLFNRDHAPAGTQARRDTYVAAHRTPISGGAGA